MKQLVFNQVDYKTVALQVVNKEMHPAVEKEQRQDEPHRNVQEVHARKHNQHRPCDYVGKKCRNPVVFVLRVWSVSRPP
jgi:hypothetical protein